jgi:beta-lactam-binding protein with PASTA domain
LPIVRTQTPPAGTRVPAGRAVRLSLEQLPIPSPSVPKRHARWTTVPQLVGHDFGHAEDVLEAIWPCVHVSAADSTDATRLVVVAQRPAPGTRVPAYGVLTGRTYHPTTVDITLAVP